MEAFVHPGIPPVWTTARKVGVGTAYSSRSKVWFTLARGIVTESYYPRVDIPNLRDLQFLITDGQTFVHEEQFDTEHVIEWVDPQAPIYRLINTDRGGRYRLIKTIITDPDSDALLMQVQFEVLQGSPEDYSLFVLAAPQVKNNGWGNSGQVSEHGGRTVLTAWREDIALALAVSCPFARTSVGFVGFSDGWQDLRNLRMDWTFETATDGHIALTGELVFPRDGEFTLALGFGSDSVSASQTAVEAVEKDFTDLCTRYVAGWKEWFAQLDPKFISAGEKDSLLYASAIVTKTHEDKMFPGAIVASLSVPWGEIRSDPNTGGYHLIWPRDLVHIASGLLAIGDRETPLNTLKHLSKTQKPNGSWPQNMWVDGAPYWRGLQLDEVAMPILLAWRLAQSGVLDFDPYPDLVRPAALFIARSGPITDQERWEENSGYSPSSLAAAIAALVCAAEFAGQATDEGVAAYLLSVADTWATKIEDWTFTHCGELLPDHPEYYERIAVVQADTARQAGTECRTFLPIRNQPNDAQISQCCLVDPSSLDLVRLGLRAADDPHVLATLPVIDGVLRTDTPCGPGWRRYNNDGYGEHENGAPFDGSGLGRVWPLLTGERGHYELAAGHRQEASSLLRTLACFANEGRMIPEQVWDAPDIPERELFLGRGTGSATPLIWAHAEYLQLWRSLSDGKVFDRIEPVYQRYVRQGVRSDLAIWKPNHQISAVRAEERIRIEVDAPAHLYWTADRWATSHCEVMAEIAPGVWAWTFPARLFSPGRMLQFTFQWLGSEGGSGWESRNFVISVA